MTNERTLGKIITDVASGLIDLKKTKTFSDVKRDLEQYIGILFKEQSKEQRKLFEQIIDVTPYDATDFSRERKGMNIFHDFTGEVKGEYSIEQIYQRNKAVLSEIEKEFVVFDQKRALIGDRIGLTVIVGSPIVPQYNFLEIYRKRDMDKLIEILEKDKVIFLSDEYRFEHLLKRVRSKKDVEFEALFNPVYEAYGKVYESENEKAVLDFNTRLQKGLEEQIIRLLPFKFSVKNWIDLDVKSQRYFGPDDIVINADFIDLNKHHASYVMDILQEFYKNLSKEEKRTRTKKDESGLRILSSPEELRGDDARLLVYDNRAKDGGIEGLSLFLMSKGKIVHISSADYTAEQLGKFLVNAKPFADKLIENDGILYYKDMSPGWEIEVELDKKARDKNSERLKAVLGNPKLIEETPEQVWGKDYQSNPKENGYKAIQQRLLGKQEIHIRTHHQEILYLRTREPYEKENKRDIPEHIRNIAKTDGRIRKSVERYLNKVYEYARELADNLHLDQIKKWIKEAQSNPESLYEALDLLDRLRLYHITEETDFIGDVKAELLKVPTAYLRNQLMDVKKEEQDVDNEEHIAKATELTDLLEFNGVFEDKEKYVNFREYLPSLAEIFSEVAYFEKLLRFIERGVESKNKTDKLRAEALFSLYDSLVDESMKGENQEHFVHLDESRETLKSDSFLDAGNFYLLKNAEPGIITSLSGKKDRWNIHKSLNNICKDEEQLNICLQALSNYLNNHYGRDDINPANFKKVGI